MRPTFVEYRIHDSGKICHFCHKCGHVKNVSYTLKAKTKQNGEVIVSDCPVLPVDRVMMILEN